MIFEENDLTVHTSRQWKNAIYTPILIEYNLRSKGFKNLYNTNLDPILEGTDAESESEEGNDTMEDTEFDEEAMLLKKSQYKMPYR